jgi:hypothetical protein
MMFVFWLLLVLQEQLFTYLNAGVDVFLTSIWLETGFLEHVQYGDLVLSNRGFDISNELALIGASLAIPPFTKGKSQLSQRGVERSRALSYVRIHVERSNWKKQVLQDSSFYITH